MVEYKLDDYQALVYLNQLFYKCRMLYDKIFMGVFLSI